tara:strand:- start:102 stop:527 length:426 start_codon:yes stop_codon:yes gene_type:complete
MVTNRKSALLLLYSILLGSIFAHSFNLPSISHNSSASDLLQMNKINHNFNFSVTSHFNGLGSTTLYSIGDQISYNFSDKLSFIGNVNLITSSSGLNQIQNSFNKPQVNFNLGLNYNFNEHTRFQLSIVKNSLDPNCNSIAY